jgi:GntR family transcriptional regulator, transcriptional repressor for pyruvate dehydrogenase complex
MRASPQKGARADEGARGGSRATMLSARRVRVPKASELIADAIRGEIARGAIRPDSPLPNETELMAHFRVARPTVREALRILEAERLIEIVRGARGGARVRQPDIRAASGHCALLLQLQGATIADVYEVRLMLEPAAARLAAERAPRAAADALAAVIAEEERIVDRQQSLAAHAMRFQETLVNLSGNPALVLLVRLLHDLVWRQAVSRVPMIDVDDAGRARLRRRLIAAQRDVTAAIAAGRAADAEKLWRRYLSDLAASVLGDMEGRAPVTRHAAQTRGANSPPA